MTIRDSAEGELNLLLAWVLHSCALSTDQRQFLPWADLGHWFGLPSAKFVCNELDRLLRVDIAADENAHIVRHIISVEIVLYVNERRVLKVFDCPDGRLLPIGMLFEHQLIKRGVENKAAIVERAILLLIDCF